MRKKLIAAAAAGFMALSSPPSFAGMAVIPPVSNHGHIPAGFWVIFGCAGDIIAAAWVAHTVYHRELTQAEAMSCGLGFWLNPKK